MCVSDEKLVWFCCRYEEQYFVRTSVSKKEIVSYCAATFTVPLSTVHCHPSDPLLFVSIIFFFLILISRITFFLLTNGKVKI